MPQHARLPHARDLKIALPQGISVCCGGILGLGEDVNDRVGLLHVLATLPEHPESVPVNALVPIKARAWAGAGGGGTFADTCTWHAQTNAAPRPADGALRRGLCFGALLLWFRSVVL